MEGHPCYTVFQEIMYHNSRLAVLSEEAIKVLDSMKTEGMSDEVIAPLMEVAVKAAGLESRDEEKEKKEIKRCKWWNRGYHREKESCSFDHPSGDCEDHLKDDADPKDAKSSGTGKYASISSQTQDVIEVKHVSIFMKRIKLIMKKMRRMWKF